MAGLALSEEQFAALELLVRSSSAERLESNAVLCKTATRSKRWMLTDGF
jgi:hypothetical protein